MKNTGREVGTLAWREGNDEDDQLEKAGGGLGRLPRSALAGHQLFVCGVVGHEVPLVHPPGRVFELFAQVRLGVH